MISTIEISALFVYILQRSDLHSASIYNHGSPEHLQRIAQSISPVFDEPIQAPTPKKPLTEFTLGCDAEGEPYLAGPVKVLNLTPLGNRLTYEAVIEHDSPLPDHYQRFIWLDGEPEPEIIAQLGIEVAR